MGCHGRVAVADTPGALAVERVSQQSLADESGPSLVHGQVDPCSPAGLRAVQQGSHYGQQCSPGGEKIGVGVAQLVGNAARLELAGAVIIQVAHECARAVGRLQGRSHGAEVAPGPGVPVPRVGDHNQVGLDRSQGCVVQAETGHHPRGEILQHDVADRHQLLEDALGLLRTQVEGEAALAPVQGLEGAALFPPQVAGLVVGKRSR